MAADATDHPAKACHRYARITPRKARLVADLVRGLNANRALEVLAFNPRRGASLLRAVIQSALANASQRQGVNLNKLVLREVFVNEGPLIKRGRPVARGRFHRIMKKTSHLHVVLDEAAPPPEKAPPPAASEQAEGGGEAPKQRGARGSARAKKSTGKPVKKEAETAGGRI